MGQTNTFTATNNSQNDVEIQSAEIDPANPAFTVQPSTPLPHTLRSSESMTFDVTAASSEVGIQTSNLVIIHDGTGSPYTAPLSANFILGSLSPDEIPGLTLWFDASQIVGLNNGDDVVLWEDLVNAVPMSNPIVSRRPHYLTNIQNGLPAVRFNKANFESLYTVGSITYLVPEQNVFLVGRLNTAIFTNPFGQGMSMITTDHGSNFSFSGTEGSTVIKLNEYGPFGSPSTLYQDGVNLPTGAITSLSPHIWDQRRVVQVTGNSKVFMAIVNESNQAGAQSMDLYESCHFDHNLTPEELGPLMQYFSAKWGIPIS